MIDCQRTEEVLESLTDSNSVMGLNQQFTRICESFFVDKFVIATISNFGCQSRKMDLFDTYPKTWMDHYVKNQYFEHDKVLEWKNVKLPFSWNMDALLEGLSPVQKKLYQEASDFGVSKGMVIPLVPNDNEQQRFLAILDIVHPHPDMVQTLSIASQLYLNTKRRLDAKQTLSQFTTRELEVLFLKSEGMPIKVVADRLAISESTVIFHLKNARHKLKASSVDHTLYLFGRAVEQARFSGLRKQQLHGEREVDFKFKQLLAA